MSEPNVTAMSFQLLADINREPEDAAAWVRLFGELTGKYHYEGFGFTSPAEVRELIVLGRAVRSAQRQDPLKR